MLRTPCAVSLAALAWHCFSQELPPGVPRTVYPDGRVSIARNFTTKAYQQEALKLVIAEANRVAQELSLPEKLPITEADLTAAFISPFGFSYMFGAIGNVATPEYRYYVAAGGKFNHLGIFGYDKVCSAMVDLGKLPIASLDTNTPYLLATQWLAALSMDVGALNRDAKPLVVLSPFWNGLARLGEPPPKSFVPIYYVDWAIGQPGAKDSHALASVELFLPQKKLLQLCVEDPKYILRKPLAFTNMAALFPGTANISTNEPVKTIIIPPEALR